MRRTLTALTRFALASAAFAAGVLLAAAPAQAGREAPRGGETGTLLVPIIGSGTHPLGEDAPITTQGDFPPCPCPIEALGIKAKLS